MQRLVLTLLITVTTQILTAQSALTLSLEEAISYATQNQPQFKNYGIDREIAGARKFQSITQYLPKVNGTVDFRDNLKLGEIALRFPNPVTGQDEDRRIQQGTKYSGTAGVDLTQPILDLGSVTDIRIAREQQRLTETQLQQALVDLKVNVTRVYYTVLLNRERVTKATKSVERFEKAYNDTKVKFDNQNALKTDLSRAYLNLSNAKYQLKVVQDSVKTSLATLAQTIGAAPDAIIELSTALASEVKPDALPEYPDYKAAELNRVELRTEALQMSVNKLQLNKTNLQYVPTLNGYGYIGGQGLDNNTLFAKDKWFWTSYIGLRMNIPIFDGLQKTAVSKQQRLALQKNENNLANIRSNINYQLKNALINYSNAYSNLVLVKENVLLAEEVVKDVTTRYSNAFATYQELLDAETTLKETEFNYLQALYAYLLAELEWKKANGQL